MSAEQDRLQFGNICLTCNHFFYETAMGVLHASKDAAINAPRPQYFDGVAHLVVELLICCRQVLINVDSRPLKSMAMRISLGLCNIIEEQLA